MDKPGCSKNTLLEGSEKASHMLMTKLTVLSQMSKNIKKETKCSPKISRKKQGKRVNKNNNKITSWLTNNKVDDEQKKSLDINDMDKKEQKENRSSDIVQRVSTFEKYGVVIPSFKQILADHKKFDEHKRQVELLKFDDEIFTSSLPPCLKSPKKFTGELLDCKHLSLDELTSSVNKHLETLSLIMDGKKHSDRHDRFSGLKTQEEGCWLTDLRCSTSVVVFTERQRDHLLDLLKLKLDPQNTLLAYFFKVLLPELCLLIFMDEHKMDKNKATAYLNERPLDF